MSACAGIKLRYLTNIVKNVVLTFNRATLPRYSVYAQNVRRHLRAGRREENCYRASGGKEK